MKKTSLLTCVALIVALLSSSQAADLSATLQRDGTLAVANVFTNGVLAVLLDGTNPLPRTPLFNVFTKDTTARLAVDLGASSGFFRVAGYDLSGGRAGFNNLVLTYSLLTTIAGAGGATSGSKWNAAFENGPATNALLSRPHMAMGDSAGNIYIADKEANGIRQVRPDGTIVTVAGTGVPGDGPNTAMPGTQVMLNQPNGLWALADGTVYILDLNNGKVRKLDPNGMLTTLFSVPVGIVSGRGLWVSDDESVAFVSSGTVVKKWTPAGGVTDFATGFADLGNLVVDPFGKLVVTDRSGHRVYRLAEDGSLRTVIAGNGSTSGGGDGQAATATGLNQVRGVWFLPSGAFFVATDAGSQIWYVEPAGTIYLFLNGGSANSNHSGDGTYFFNPSRLCISKARAITMAPNGDLLIPENDLGYVRRVRFLPYLP